MPLTTLYSFTGTDGADPIGGVTIDANGDLFGTTSNGGLDNDGTVFEIKAGATAATTLYSFTGTGTDGADPDAGVTLNANGDLFGTTFAGGSYGIGTVFELAAGATAVTTLYSFTENGTDGGQPYAGVTLDANGDLFGTTLIGGPDEGGTVFELKAGAATATTLYDFTPFDTSGGAPFAGVTLDANGDLFGATDVLGSGGDGAVFELTPGETAPTTIYGFTGNGTDGANPEAALTLDANGDLFGTTVDGGSDGEGTVFEIAAGATTATTLYSFTGVGTDGSMPYTDVILDANGDLFGTAGGGASDGGTVFEIKAGATTATTLYSFIGVNGASPHAGLTADANGDLFGTTSGGGSDSEGTVFEITDSGFVVCYLRGTHILTPTGEALIEELKIGDLVVTASGEHRAIRWLGHRSINCVQHPDPEAVWPVCIRAGALSYGKPTRDLWVTRGHSFLFDDVLIQAEKLINGVTIVQQPRDQIEIWHIELDSHDIILAEGVPAESYIDTGNRTGFAGGGAFLELYPDFEPKDWTETCVPLVFDGPKLTRAKTLILEVAAQGGHDITAEADMHIVADGNRIEPVWLTETRVAFMLPAIRKEIALRSRQFVPRHCQPESQDDRTLGIAVERLQIDGADVAIDDDAALSIGWNGFEHHENGHRQRWTRGDTPLPANARLIVIDIAGRGYYWADRKSNLVALFG